jgi:hypothetical protein
MKYIPSIFSKKNCEGIGTAYPCDMMMRVPQSTVGAYGIVSGEGSVEEVEGPGPAVLVFRLEVVRREEGQRGGGTTNRDVAQECICRRPVLQLIETNTIEQATRMQQALFSSP